MTSWIFACTASRQHGQEVESGAARSATHVGAGLGDYRVVEQLVYVGEGKGDVHVENQSASRQGRSMADSVRACAVDKASACSGFYKFAVVSIVVLLFAGTACALIPYGRAVVQAFGPSTNRRFRVTASAGYDRSAPSMEGLQDKSSVRVERSLHQPVLPEKDAPLRKPRTRPAEMSLADWWHPAIATAQESQLPPQAERPADRSQWSSA